MPVAAQTSAFLCQYLYWADRSMALRVFDKHLDPRFLGWIQETFSGNLGSWTHTLLRLEFRYRVETYNKLFVLVAVSFVQCVLTPINFY